MNSLFSVDAVTIFMYIIRIDVASNMIVMFTLFVKIVSIAL